MHKPELNTFYHLQPNQILDFIQDLGEIPTGQVYQLNSYENRVFDIFMESGNRWVAKFYRPLRWSTESIQEEHDFCFELEEASFPVISPMKFDGESVVFWNDIRVAIFPRVAGRNPDELLTNDYQHVGAKLALLHNVGARKQCQHRLQIGSRDYIEPAYDILENFVAPEVRERYWTMVDALADYIDANVNDFTNIRLQGDCHKGNLISSDNGFMFVDFDDFCMGPAVQDIWMLTYSPDNDERQKAQDLLLESYSKLRDWNPKELEYVEALRGLRIVHYAAWIAKRWQDPNFPKLFPQFLDYNYWAEEAETLEKIVWMLEH